MSNLNNSNKSKTNEILFSQQQSYPENINIIQNARNDNGNLNNLSDKNSRSINKMNILPFKPARKEANSEPNYKVIGILIIFIIFLALISLLTLLLVRTTNDEKKEQIIVTFLLEAGKETTIFNKHEKDVNYSLPPSRATSLRRLDKDEELFYNNIYTSNENGLFKFEINFVPKLINLSHLFDQCQNLVEVDLSRIKSPNIKYMSNMFTNCPNLRKITFSSLKTSKVKDMKGLFKGCYNLSEIIGLENLDTSSLRDITEMFEDCRNLVSVDLSSFNLSKIEKKKNVFNNNTLLTYIDLTNTGNITDIKEIFNETFFDNRTNHIYIKINKEFIQEENIPGMNFTEKLDIECIKTINDKDEKCASCKDDKDDPNKNIYCESCNPGYFLPKNSIYFYPSCFECKKNCEKCNLNEIFQTECTICEQGFSKNNSECIENGKNPQNTQEKSETITIPSTDVKTTELYNKNTSKATVSPKTSDIVSPSTTY